MLLPRRASSCEASAKTSVRRGLHTLTHGYGWSILLFFLCWTLLGYPWLSGAVTIPYDAKAHFYPQLQFLATALHSGQSPFWAPNEFAGSPQAADPQSLIFSPAIIIAMLSAYPTFWMFDTYVLGLLALGSLGIMLYFRDRQWHPAGALVAALAFCFGSSASWRIQHIGEIQSYAIFGVSFWLLARALDRRSVRYAFAGGVAIGIMMMEPDQVALLADYLMAGYVVTEIVHHSRCWADVRRYLPSLCTVCGTSVVIALVPIVMTYLFVEDSIRPVISLSEAAHGSLHPASLLTVVIGDLFSVLDPKVGYWGPYSMSWDPSEITLSQNMGQVYVGIVPAIVVLGLGVACRRLFDREIRFFALSLCAILAYALGTFTPIFKYIYEIVPGVNLFRRPADATFMIGALLAIVAGYLVHILYEARTPKMTRAQISLSVALFGACALLASAIAIHEHHFAAAARSLASATVLACCAAVLLAMSCRARAGLQPVLLAALAGFYSYDLKINNGPSESTALPAAQYEFMTPDSKNETVRFLKTHVVRSPGTDRRDRVELVGMGFSWGNLGLAQGFDHLMGYNPLRLNDVVKAIGAPENIPTWNGRVFTPLFPSYRSLMADMLGLRYVVTPVPIEKVDKSLKVGDLRLAARVADSYIYENLRAFPRVMFVPHWQTAKFDTLVKTGAWPDFDPKRTLLLEHPPETDDRAERGAYPVIEPASARGSASTAASVPSHVSISHFENTVIEIEVDAPEQGFLLFNSVWHPWWRATVDGQPTKVLKANVLFRAVQVPKGPHHVHFEFDAISGAIAQAEELSEVFYGHL